MAERCSNTNADLTCNKPNTGSAGSNREIYQSTKPQKLDEVNLHEPPSNVSTLLE